MLNNLLIFPLLLIIDYIFESFKINWDYFYLLRYGYTVGYIMYNLDVMDSNTLSINSNMIINNNTQIYYNILYQEIFLFIYDYLSCVYKSRCNLVKHFHHTVTICLIACGIFNKYLITNENFILKYSMWILYLFHITDFFKRIVQILITTIKNKIILKIVSIIFAIGYPILWIHFRIYQFINISQYYLDTYYENVKIRNLIFYFQYPQLDILLLFGHLLFVVTIINTCILFMYIYKKLNKKDKAKLK